MIVSKRIASVVIGILMILCLSVSVYATDEGLNGMVNANITVDINEIETEEEQVGQVVNEGAEENKVIVDEEIVENRTETTEPTKNDEPLSFLPATSEGNKKDSQDAAKAIGEMFSNAGVDEESIREANEFIKPFAVIMNKLMAIILGITSLLMMFITVLDLLYMAFPPVRDMLDGGATGGQQMKNGARNRGMQGMRGQMGMGMPGGVGMGMDGGMGMGGISAAPPRQQQAGGGMSAIGRWVSDEAIAACVECQGGPMGTVQNGPQVGPVKSMIFTYMKKRSMFLILFGICVILFTSTVFTDLGIRIGTYLLNLIMGFGN